MAISAALATYGGVVNPDQTSKPAFGYDERRVRVIESQAMPPAQHLNHCWGYLSEGQIER
jgi:hypothetical protein